MKILDAKHIEKSNIQVTFLKGRKKEVKNINLTNYLKSHSNKFVNRMIDSKKLSDIDIHLHYLSWPGNVLDLDADTLYSLSESFYNSNI